MQPVDDDYRIRERECALKAQASTDPKEQAKWNELADAWRKLASGAHVFIHTDTPLAPSEPPSDGE